MTHRNATDPALHHVGVAVDNADRLLTLLAPLGLSEQRTVRLAALGLTSTFVTVGQQRLEFLELHDADARAQTLGGHPSRLHHVALTVGDLIADMERLRAAGVRFQGPTGTREIYEPIAAPGALHAWTVPESCAGLMLQLTQPTT